MTTTRNGAEIEHAIGATGEFNLRLHTGHVEVRATDGEVARVRDLDGGDLEERFAIERDAGRLAVLPRDRLMLELGPLRKGRSARGRLAVELPRAATTSIDTASARVQVEGLTGEQRYRSVSGDIRLTAVGGVLAVDAVSGSVEIDATAEADLSGRLVSGDLRLHGVGLRTVALGTASGDVQLDAPLVGPGPYGIQTVSGDVHVVAAHRGLRVEARTVTGEVASDASHQSTSRRDNRSLIVGDGAFALSFKSVSGDLHVAGHRRDSGEVASHASPEPPAPPPPPAAPEPPHAATGAAEEADPRLAILVDLEAGAIDVETATRRLAEVEGDLDA